MHYPDSSKKGSEFFNEWYIHHIHKNHIQKQPVIDYKILINNQLGYGVIPPRSGLTTMITPYFISLV